MIPNEDISYLLMQDLVLKAMVLTYEVIVDIMPDD